MPRSMSGRPTAQTNLQVAGKLGTVFPSGQSGQIWPSTGPVYAKGGLENHDLTGLQRSADLKSII